MPKAAASSIQPRFDTESGLREVDTCDVAAEARIATAPFLTRRGLKGWPALDLWTPEFLAARLANLPVNVIVTGTGTIRYTADGEPENPRDQMEIQAVPFAEACQWVLSSEAAGDKYYVSQQNVFRRLPSLLEDIAFPNHGQRSSYHLWFGPAGVSTPLHYDEAANLYAQIYGDKSFVLFSPADTKYLYKYPDGTDFAHMSRIDMSSPLDRRFPEFTKATPVKVMLQPGDLLFIPPDWWHFVVSESVSIAVSHWWPPEAGPNQTPQL